MGNGPDWGNGAYEKIAPHLVPAAERLIEIANPQKGERAIDLGCGTGNATVPLAATGAQVTAIDPSLRLLGITAERVRAEGLRITTSIAKAEQIPLPDADADLVISNFGVIFSEDPPAALAETLRVLTGQGRFLFTAWLPEGPIADVGRLMVGTITDATPRDGAPPTDATPSMTWHDPSTYAHLVPGGADAISVHHGEAEFTADSAEEWLGEQVRSHPLWLASRREIQDDAVWQRVLEESTRILAEQSEGSDRFLVRSPYAVVEIRPQG